MTTPRGRHQPADPAAVPRDGIQAPIRRVVAPRRGLRQQAGIVAVGAVLLTVIAAGIGIGGREDEPGPSGSAGVAEGSPGASRSGGAPGSPLPSERPGPCQPLPDPEGAPEFRIWSTTGEEPERAGARPLDPDAGWPVPVSEWTTPRLSQALTLERRSGIVVVPGRQTCIQRVIADYRAAEGDGTIGIGLAHERPSPPTGRVVLGGMPPGDWVVAIAVTYATDPTGSGAGVEVVRFFRVLAGVVDPPPSPLVTPALPCGELSVDANPDLFLTGTGEPVPGVRLDTFAGDMLHNGAVVEATFDGDLVLSTGGDACLVSWNVQWLEPNGGGLLASEEQPNAWQDPRVVSQNRLSLRSTFIGRVVVTAFVSFGPGREGSYAWEVILTAPGIPGALVRTESGLTSPTSVGCGVTWSKPSGEEAYESCERFPVPSGTPVLAVDAGEPLEVTIPDTAIMFWSVGCGEADSDTGEFISPMGCDLGSGNSDPIRFLPWPGGHVIQIWIQGQLPDGTTFSAPYFIHVDALE